MSSNGDSYREFKVGGDSVRGLGSFHKTLGHNRFGEVDQVHFEKLINATEGDTSFSLVPQANDDSARLVNPQAGLAHDKLTRHPASYSMLPAPTVLSKSTTAEMVELYWMAVLRDQSFHTFDKNPDLRKALAELNRFFRDATGDSSDAGHLQPGIDLPGSATSMSTITAQNIFRIGLPGEEVGPLVSQFFLRPAGFGTQTISQQQRPYKSELNFLTDFAAWLSAQNLGRDKDGQDYSGSNQLDERNFENHNRHIATMRDLARFVHKDALHQAYFNAALLLLSGGARWNFGNPYSDSPRYGFGNREAGFGTLGGPHILALVSEVATRALKIVWNQKWQVHLRLRPEAYGGLAHVQFIGIGDNKSKRPYGLPKEIAKTEAAKRLLKHYKGLLLPMAFTSGSPVHPAYGAGHATVAGACVTVLKGFFQTFDRVNGQIRVRPLTGEAGLGERTQPFGKPSPFTAHLIGKDDKEKEVKLPVPDAHQLTIEGELNKLAANVAMGRSMGGVHWRSDNTRSLLLGEAIAAEILADISMDLNEKPSFEFRSFSRKADGEPKIITIKQGRILVDGIIVDQPSQL
jgi:hypothetical protein